MLSSICGAHIWLRVFVCWLIDQFTFDTQSRIDYKSTVEIIFPESIHRALLVALRCILNGESKIRSKCVGVRECDRQFGPIFYSPNIKLNCNATHIKMSHTRNHSEIKLISLRRSIDAQFRKTFSTIYRLADCVLSVRPSRSPKSFHFIRFLANDTQIVLFGTILVFWYKHTRTPNERESA